MVKLLVPYNLIKASVFICWHMMLKTEKEIANDIAAPMGDLSNVLKVDKTLYVIDDQYPYTVHSHYNDWYDIFNA